jgi:hypothetical protein
MPGPKRPSKQDERFSIDADPEDALRTLTDAPPDAEAWAREHVRLTTADHHKNGLTWVARIKAHGLLFEGRATGPSPKREALRRRATDAAVRDYLDFLEQSNR